VEEKSRVIDGNKMIQHPVFQSRQTIGIYFGTWTFIAGVHFSLIYFLYKQNLIVSIADSLFFNALYAILGLAVWYIVRFSLPKTHSFYTLLVNQFASILIILLLWMGLSFSALKYIFDGQQKYLIFLDDSIPWRLISGTFFYFLMVLIYYLFIYYQNLQDKIRDESRLNEAVRESELNLLKSQINPHFLFNSLNSISSLTVTNPAKAQEMTVKLSDFLRYSVSQNDTGFTTLEMEMNNISKYLDIEKTRFGSKLFYHFDIPDSCKKLEIPVMILQPLYENAVKHGVYESTGEVSIFTKVIRNQNLMEISIENNFESGVPSRKGAGIGLKNIRERLKLIYQDDSLVQTQIKDQIFNVTICIPDKK
jgi:two-component system, LytTR family, sensor kinase